LRHDRVRQGAEQDGVGLDPDGPAAEKIGDGDIRAVRGHEAGQVRKEESALTLQYVGM
jgi:hypothetical protein